MTEAINVRDLYTQLKTRAAAKSEEFSMLNLVVRLKHGLTNQHSSIVLGLYWWHIFLTDRPLYSRLKSATDESSMRQILGGRVSSSYVQGVKTVTLDTCIFPREFLEIINAYVEYTDELCQ